MKRESASTLFIHGYPWALSYLFRSLALLFQLFEMVLLCVVFENVLKRGHHCGNLCNDSCFNVYKGVFCLLKSFQCFESRVLKLCCEVCFENSKDVCLKNRASN